MKILKMQPTFTVDIPVNAQDAVAEIRRAIESSELQSLAVAAGPCVDFKIEPSDQRFWSPHLSIQLSDTESGSQIFGRFSPRPEVWTMFMAIYGVAAICSFAAAIYAYVQWFMGSTPWAILVVPTGIAVILGLHVASLIGQNLSADQMNLLRERFDRVLEIAFEHAALQQPAGK